MDRRLRKRKIKVASEEERQLQKQQHIPDAALASYGLNISPAFSSATPIAVLSLDLLEHAVKVLSQADPKLAPLIAEHGPPSRMIAKSGMSFRSLAKSILYQQLAGKAAACIYARFLTTCGIDSSSSGTSGEAVGDEQLLPQHVLKTHASMLRACGLSERKASYVLELAQHFHDGKLSDEVLAGLNDDELQTALTAVRGIGPWTVDMFAMFHLGRPDVLPVGDLGVRKGMQVLYGLKSLPSPAEMQRISECWRPFRSVGCYYMWKVPMTTTSPGRKSSKKAQSAVAAATAAASVNSDAATGTTVMQQRVVAAEVAVATPTSRGRRRATVKVQQERTVDLG
eukprot:jgi/Chrzof1/6964/Cz02g05210.t1